MQRKYKEATIEWLHRDQGHGGRRRAACTVGKSVRDGREREEGGDGEQLTISCRLYTPRCSPCAMLSPTEFCVGLSEPRMRVLTTECAGHTRCTWPCLAGPLRGWLNLVQFGWRMSRQRLCLCETRSILRLILLACEVIHTSLQPE